MRQGKDSECHRRAPVLNVLSAGLIGVSSETVILGICFWREGLEAAF